MRVARRPIVGVERVAKFLAAISTWFWDDLDLRFVGTNGQTSVVVRHEGDVRCVFTIGASTEGIDHVLWMFNPEKIAGVSLPA